MAATLLAFNIPANVVGKLRFLTAGMGIKVHVVPEEKFGWTLDEILSNKGNGCSEETGGFDEPLFVMADMTEAQFNGLLKLLRQPGMPPKSLKAVVTPYNAEWSAVKLYAELSAERAAFEQGKQAHR